MNNEDQIDNQVLQVNHNEDDDYKVQDVVNVNYFADCIVTYQE